MCLSLRKKQEIRTLTFQIDHSCQGVWMSSAQQRESPSVCAAVSANVGPNDASVCACMHRVMRGVHCCKHEGGWSSN